MSRRVLLGITGGVAAYKSAHLARLLTAAGAEVTVVMTESATRFVGPDTFAALTGRPVHTSLWERPGEVLHVRLAHEADLAIVAPATANLLAKLAHGLADDLLTSTLLEYAGPLVIAPAMHTGMWEHPATRGNVETLEGRGVTFVGPVEGALAHGDSGVGRFAEPEIIAAEALAVLDGAAAGSMIGRTVVVTAGPTHEPIDPVRFIGNHSSGKMGVAVAAEAVRRGATVYLILGPGTVAPPAGAQVVRITTAEQMREAVMRYADDTDAIVMAAAVADFRPKDAATGKLKKDDGTPEVTLEPTPDILAELGERPRRPYLVGFAAETSDVEAHGRAKLARKHADLLVANEVGREGTGFGSETNHAAVVSVNGDDIALRDWTKRELASVIVDRIEAALRAEGPGH
ncbi:MAG TPA: bifunctional phosphopantothenoylcysteine decarboxylase/phosphopantothenate--cysteine ligase CoaBC [Nocardioidaceae bacterium]|nr:bifunctional phosphopantothenoylcysteine decarboxylase/phosphopantothenate--cysteine ligase CoaBC [Nocardioidaceae bacterium]